MVVDVPPRPTSDIAAALAARAARRSRARVEQQLRESAGDEVGHTPDTSAHLGRAMGTLLTDLSTRMGQDEVWRDIWRLPGTNGHNTAFHLLLLVATSHGIWLAMYGEKVYKPRPTEGIPWTPVPYGAFVTRRVITSYVPKVKRLPDGRVEIGTYKWFDPSTWLEEMHTTPPAGPVPRFAEELREALAGH